MKANGRISLKVILGVVTTISLLAFASPTTQAEEKQSRQWSVQVDRVVPSSEVTMEPAFQVAIYEQLLDELGKTKTFDKVFRSGDRKASEAPDLVILKTTILKYAPGSQTRRAVTTVSGATKIKVRFQLCTRSGQLVAEREVDGNVRFFGGNLRATHNLARHVANAIKQASLPALQ